MAGNRMTLGLLILGLCLPDGRVQGQRLEGRVLEGTSRELVVGASIQVLDSTETAIETVLTDSVGGFVVDLVRAGAYRIRVEHLAYRLYVSEAIDVDRGEGVVVEIRLGRTVLPLEPLVVEARRLIGRLAGYRERLESDPFGKFVTREEMERRPASRPTDFLRSVPGVSVLPVKRADNPLGLTVDVVAMRGSVGFCSPALYLDGTRIQQSNDAPIDDLLHAGVLEGIEVYTSVIAAPLQYQQATGCGVVLFWTREAEPGGRRGWWRIAVGVGAFAGILLLTAAR